MEPVSPQNIRYLVFSQLLHIVKAFKSEQVVCFPTETLYGLGGMATSERATRDILGLKGRSPESPLPVLFANRQQLDEYLEVPAELNILLEHFWPGPLTVVLKARRELPAGVSSASGEVAARITSHRLLRTVIDYVGPISATSANRSGEDPALTAESCAALGPHVIIMDDPCASQEASTIVAWRDGELQVLREGAISSEYLQQALKQA
ncbi:L-threonylcarbamoyladenylate synthase [Desulfurispira natronophila]|uniref:L-threonylcarbamoyladenylate synthase n=1 Tax=Desulfurispira natronophila TaxID=682562 RepID=A0A7W8DH69_9BACT|nr:L-threonylcarbamoyladenylate synthase [Desulfurispira natronophila]MBB5022185.1 L-threonylcarbamoyladenylate synthase [Desulfurispira natronophila]